MAIQIQGYEAVFPNEVYKSVKSVIAADEGIKPEYREQKAILLLARTRNPDEDSVLRHIQERARTFVRPQGILTPQGMHISVRDGLEAALVEASSKGDMLRNIATESDPQLIELIRSNIPARKLAEGQMPQDYLMITFGFAPVGILIEHSQALRNGGYNGYREMLESDGLRDGGTGRQYVIKLQIQEDGSLSSLERVTRLIEEGCTDSRLIKLNGVDEYNPKAFEAVKRQVIMPIYLDERQFSQHVSDIPATEQEFDEQGGIALIRTLQFYKMAALAQAQHRQMIETPTLQGRRNRGPSVQ